MSGQGAKRQTHGAARTTRPTPGTFDKMGEISYFPASNKVKIKGNDANGGKMRIAGVSSYLGS